MGNQGSSLNDQRQHFGRTGRRLGPTPVQFWGKKASLKSSNKSCINRKQNIAWVYSPLYVMSTCLASTEGTFTQEQHRGILIGSTSPVPAG